MEVGRGPAADADSLYESARGIEWEAQLGQEMYFAIRATGSNEALHHSHFVEQRVKDAVVDRLREGGLGRPEVDAKDPDLLIVVHLAGDEVTFFLDLAGGPLHRRGWRLEQGDAPLKETLAAAVLAFADFDAERPLVDPMCGSGTIVIEAALARRRRPPAAGSKPSALHWAGVGYEAISIWRTLAEEARDQLVKGSLPPLIGRDHNAELLEIAERNAKRAGVLGEIRFESGDARRLHDLPEGASMVANPPYGERVGGKRLQLEGFYRAFGAAWREQAQGSPLVVMSGHDRFSRHFGAKALQSHTIWNGPLKCELLRFGELVERAD